MATCNTIVYPITDPACGDGTNILLGKLLQKANDPPPPIGTIALEVSDMEIGAVEIKDGASNQRATVNGAGELLVSGTFSMPAGAATEAKQDAGNASLVSIDAGIPAGLGQATMAGSMPVVLASDQTALPVTGTFFQATQPISGSVSVSNFPASQAVTGTVAVSNFPASQAVTGTFFQATQPVSGTFFQATQPVSIAAAVAVTGTFWQATQPVSGSVGVSNFPASQAVTGTFFQATQPVSIAAAVTVDQGTSPWVVSGNLTTVTAVTAITNALPVGANVIGKVSIDQTTPGTTNKVTLGADVVAVSGTLALSGTVATAEVAPTAVKSNRVAVATAGTQVNFANVPLQAIVVKALSTNTGIIYVGDATVDSATGLELSPGDTVAFNIDNANRVWIDSSVDGESVTWLGTV